MLPRKKLDIGWVDLGLGGVRCLFPPNRHGMQSRVEQDENTLATLSVRTGFDLLLQHLALPRGSEVLLSAMTIRDMVSIIEYHGLIPVAIDIAPANCTLDLEHLRRSITPQSKILLVAHLFGSRMTMDSIIDIAQQHQLMVIEDAAQAFMADGYRGHPHTDVTMFSFGSIKTATALGGALFIFQQPVLKESICQLQSQLPIQSTRSYLAKIAKYSVLKALSYPIAYTVFVALCKAFRSSHDRLISQAVRGFAGGELIQKIRFQPCTALLALLLRRLSHYSPADLQARSQAAEQLSARLPTATILGRRAAPHTHWVFPLLSAQPDQLVAYLQSHGFDATRGASSMYAVASQSPLVAQEIMQHLLYLPVDAGVSADYLHRLANAVSRHETPTSSGILTHTL